MSTNLTTFEDIRDIADTFMNGAFDNDFDGEDEEGKFIDCKIRVYGISSRLGKCLGASMGSTNDSSGLGALKFKLVGGNSVVTKRYALGMIHPLMLDKIYPADSNGVAIYY
jgi:hypothetical protein